MNTCREHIDYFSSTGKLPNPMWVHALDVLTHCLKGETKDTFYKCNKISSENHLGNLRAALDGKPKELDCFKAEKHNAFVQERRWRRFDSECGDLVVDRLIDGDPRPFDDYRKKFVDKPAVSIIMDVSVPFVRRDGTDVAMRHEQIYKYAINCNKEGRPCRVIGVEKHDIDECLDFRTFFVLKDFDEPIFPSIWAAFETNKTTNDFMNVFMDYFIGTHHSGNGTPRHYDIAGDFDDKSILVEPKTYVYDSRKGD